VEIENRWEKLPDEGALWYARFEVFRLAGSSRTIEGAYRSATGLHRLSSKRPGAQWYKAVERFQWWARAEAWDEAERVRIRGLEARRRFDARERRLAKIGRLIEVAEAVLESADLAEMTVEQARELLPTVRLLMRDMLAAERAELGLPMAEGSAVLPFSADELGLARGELIRLGFVTVGVYGSEASED
jgi:hypothetical protein